MGIRRYSFLVVVSATVLLGNAFAQTNTFPTVGYVGIGTTTPGTLLDVNGNTRIAPTSASWAEGLQFYMPNPSTWGGLRWSRNRSNWDGNFYVGYTALDATDDLVFGANNAGSQVDNILRLTKSGKVGIGTAAPQTMLDVAGVINGRSFSIPATWTGGSWANIGTFTGGAGETIRITAYIHQGYNASNGQDATYFINFKTSNGPGGSTNGTGFAGNGSWYAIGYNSTIPQGNIVWVANNPGNAATSYTLYIYLPIYTAGSHYQVSVDQNASWTNSGTLVGTAPGPASSTVLIPPSEFDLPYGNVGIGTNSSAYKLEVNGSMRLTAGSGASVTYQDGTVQSTAWNGVLQGGDYAESVDVSGDRAQYAPGDVLVIDPASKGKFLKSSKPYSTAVMGVYSTRPGVVGRRQKTDTSHMKDEVPLAMVGVVPTKVTAEGGAIKAGDLLVTSSRPGYAMKGTDRSLLTGAIIGKALEPLNSGTGVIEVAVSIQ